MLSIIIPVLNEQQSIGSLLDLLCERAHDLDTIEFVVVDGGSIDHTIGAVEQFAAVNPKVSLKIIETSRGRGHQLHEGSRQATHDIYYFLHADSHPPKDYDYLIFKAVESGRPAGCFRMRFRSSHPWLIFIGWFTRFSWKVSRGGDQSQYITRELYNAVGGYNTTVPIYEDYLLINELYDNYSYYVIPSWLTTSARRYEEIGVLRLQLFYLTIYWKKRQGASIQQIYDYYQQRCIPPETKELLNQQN